MAARGASAAGFSTGFRVGLETARQRRIEEEERARRREREDFAFERAKTIAPDEDRLRRLQIESAEFGLERARERAPREDEALDLDIAGRRFDLERAQARAPREDEALDLDIATRRFGLERARAAAPAEDRLRDLSVQSAELGLEGDRFELSRSRTLAGQQDEDRAREEAAAAAQNLPEIFEGLNKGIDPSLLLRRYNEQSPRKLASIEYNPTTGMVRLVDDEGEAAEHTLDQWRRAYPMPEAEPVRLGKDDRLVDPNTGEEIVGPAAGTLGADALGGRDISPYNPETVQKNIEAGIVRDMGGVLDTYGNASFSNEDDRELGSYRIALGQEMESRLRPYIVERLLAYGQIVNAVMEATRGMPTISELRKQAQEELDPWGPGGAREEDVEAWVDSKLEEHRANALRKLARTEQRLLSEALRRRGNTLAGSGIDTKPEWAGDEVPASVVGENINRMQLGKEYDVRINGRETTVRLGRDGKVYEVASRQASPPAPSAPMQSAPPADWVRDIAQPRSETPSAPAESSEPPPPPAPPAPEPTAEGEARYGAGRPGIADELALVGDLMRARPWIRAPRERERRGLPSLQSLREARGQRAVVERVRAAFASGRAPRASDLRILAGLDDAQLGALGLSPDEIQAVRDRAAVESALSQARGTRAQPSY